MPTAKEMDNRISRLSEQFERAGATGNKVHVAARSDEWMVFKDRAKKVSRVFPSREQAIAYARRLFSSGSADALVIHKTDGTVEEYHASK